MTISEIMVKMIGIADGSRHGINHFMKVHSFARAIGALEKPDSRTQYIPEAGAIRSPMAIRITPY